MRSAISGTIGVRFAKVFLGVLAAVISARALGPAGRGEYFLVISIAALVVQFGNFGLHASNTYYVARDPSKLPGLAANSLWVAVMLGVICGVAAAPVARLIGLSSGSELWQAVVIVVLVPSGLYVLLGMNLLIGIGRVRLFNAVDIASNLLALALIVIAAILFPTVVAFLAAASVSAVATALLVYQSVRTHAGPSMSFDPRLFRAGLRFAGKAYASSVLALVVLRINVFTLSHFVRPTEVGNYSVALQFMDVLGIVPSATALVLFPTLVRNRSDAWMSTLRNAAVVGVVLAVLSSATALIGPRLITTVFGAGFEGAADILLVLLPGVILVGMATVFSQFLIAVGFPILLVFAWAGAAAAVGTLGIATIPTGAGRAAGSALSLTYAGLFVFILGLAFAHRHDRAGSPADS